MYRALRPAIRDRERSELASLFFGPRTNFTVIDNWRCWTPWRGSGEQPLEEAIHSTLATVERHVGGGQKDDLTLLGVELL